LEERINKSFVEQWTRDEEVSQLCPLKTHKAELDRLQMELAKKNSEFVLDSRGIGEEKR